MAHQKMGLKYCHQYFGFDSLQIFWRLLNGLKSSGTSDCSVDCANMQHTYFVVSEFCKLAKFVCGSKEKMLFEYLKSRS